MLSVILIILIFSDKGRGLPEKAGSFLFSKGLFFIIFLLLTFPGKICKMKEVQQVILWESACCFCWYV